MAKLERYLTFAGYVILIAFIGALLMPLRFDIGWRGLKEGVIGATFFLEIVWFILGAIIALIHWHSTKSRFRVVLVLNSFAFVLIVVESFRELSAR
ncbi:MAG TPA: hypothetical protein VFR24_19535 [Candidatus Angelobacter sp.]|nr:hypothetical protein [Candidatus Angelobacter sp.]